MSAPASSRPLILVSTDLFGDPVREGIRRQYLDAVIEAGGLPVQVPVGLDEASIEALVESASGLLLTGGADVDPKRYGEEKSEQCGEILPERDEAECALTRAALREGLPVLAICRGLQVLNVVAGGTLIQDIPEELGLPLTAHRQEGDYVETVHEVEIVPDRRGGKSRRQHEAPSGRENAGFFPSGRREESRRRRRGARRPRLSLRARRAVAPGNAREDDVPAQGAL